MHHLDKEGQDARAISGACCSQYPPTENSEKNCVASRHCPSQLNTHLSASLVEWVAQHCGDAQDLGKKGVTGIRHSQATRREYLEDPRHRIRFVYTPKHASWLNQVEIWFSILYRRLLKRGNFTSTADLRQQILDFIDYFNQLLAKPFRWTYAGKPLTA